MNIEYIYSKILKKLQGRALINVKQGREVKIYAGCQIYNSTIGNFTYCSYHTSMNNVEVGKFCCIASNVVVGAAEHPINWVSMSPLFEDIRNSGSNFRFAREKVLPVKRTYIGNDVWIGIGATIKQGVHIGNGAVIAAMAVVTKDVPPYSIVAGVPAKIIKYRFTRDIIERLNSSEWWNLDDYILKELGRYIKEPEIFLDRLKIYQCISDQ